MCLSELQINTKATTGGKDYSRDYCVIAFV